MFHPRLSVVLVFGLFYAAFALPAQAQSVREEVRALNQQALEAYQSLEIDQSVQILERALVVAERGGLGGSELARTHALLGIVAIAGLSDDARGLAHFQRALQADPAVQLDPSISTPEINATFQQARARLAGHTAPPTTTTQAPVPEMVDGLTHTPFQEQLMRTPVPIYVAVSDALRVTRIVVRYRSRGMRNYAELALNAMVEGYGVEIPCTDVFEPLLEYYVVAYDGDREVGHVGSQQTPIPLRIVRVRRYAPPALPGRIPPQQCSEHECPPNLPSCRRDTPGNGTPGRQSSDDEGDTPRENDDGPDLPRLYLQLGGVAGAGYAHADMVADRLPAVEGSTTDAFVSPDEDPSCDAPAGEYCVRVTTAGFVPVFGARLMVGYFVVPRVAIAVGGRFSFLAGKGTFSHMLLSFRTEILATKPAELGFRALVHVGTSFGQIQVRPAQRLTSVEPWAQVGLGSAQVGTTIGYRFMRNLGVYAAPELHVFFRRVNVALEVALGLEAAF